MPVIYDKVITPRTFVLGVIFFMGERYGISDDR